MKMQYMKHTFDEVRQLGYDIGLREEQLSMFVQYMMRRGFNNSHTSYVEEWAHRFFRKDEFVRSDGDGQRILKELSENKVEKFAKGDYKE